MEASKPGFYPGYVILVDGELLDSGHGDDSVTVYGPHDDQRCVDRAVSVLGLGDTQEVSIRKVHLVDWMELKGKDEIRKELENG